MPEEQLTCPTNGQPIDQKYIGKWSDQLWLAYCHCGKVHELVPTVPRHLLCDAEGCDGEMIGTGHGITTLETKWAHRCNKCGKEAWANSK